MTDAKTARDVLADEIGKAMLRAQLKELGEEVAAEDFDSVYKAQKMFAKMGAIAAGYHITPAAPVSTVDVDGGVLPCPFCGEPGRGRLVPWAPLNLCKGCAASAPDTETWNRRATPIPPAPAVRDDGARVRALEAAAQICTAREQHYSSMLSNSRGTTIGEAYHLAMKAFRTVAEEIRSLAAATTVAGRDGERHDLLAAIKVFRKTLPFSKRRRFDDELRPVITGGRVAYPDAIYSATQEDFNRARSAVSVAANSAPPSEEVG